MFWYYRDESYCITFSLFLCVFIKFYKVLLSRTYFDKVGKKVKFEVSSGSELQTFGKVLKVLKA